MMMGSVLQCSRERDSFLSMERCGVTVRYFEREIEREREREGNMGGYSGRLRYLKKGCKK